MRIPSAFLRMGFLFALWTAETEGFLPKTTSRTANTNRNIIETQMSLGAGEWAKRLGKLVGESMHDSEWKRIPEEFQKGMEEGEIDARARNAKPMELLPSTADVSAEDEDKVEDISEDVDAVLDVDATETTTATTPLKDK